MIRKLDIESICWTITVIAAFYAALSTYYFYIYIYIVDYSIDIIDTVNSVPN